MNTESEQLICFCSFVIDISISAIIRCKTTFRPLIDEIVVFLCLFKGLGNVDPLYCPSVLLPIRYTAHPTYCNI